MLQHNTTALPLEVVRVWPCVLQIINGGKTMTAQLSRRDLLAAVAAGGVATCCGGTALGREPAKKAKTAIVQVTDLFRPFADPDDHWDLACTYALAFRGDVDLLGVIIDYPPRIEFNPDVQAVAQMNYLTGRATPVVFGSPRRIDPADADRPENRVALGGMRALLDILRRSERPVTINVLGSSRDVALAGRLEPKLFAERCAGVYLNAGSGTPDKSLATRLEYNVALDPVSYAAIFDLPCPVYWMPCFDVAPGPQNEAAVAGPHGTYYKFQQKRILPHLSPRVQNYFAFMFKQGFPEQSQGKQADAFRPNWLHYLEGPNDRELLARQGEQYRNMWCTGGFLHAAGIGVESDGRLVPLDEVKSPLFTFDPVQVQCDAKGVTTWTADPTSRNRFLFHVRDQSRYESAMTTAMRTLLGALP
jgi:hypothetical protein